MAEPPRQDDPPFEPLPGLSQQAPANLIAPSPPATKDRNLAVASLVFAILAWFMNMHAAAAIPAVILGVIQRRRIRREPERYDGDGMALAGIVAGGVNLGLTVLAILAVLALYLVPLLIVAIAALVDHLS